MAQGQNAQKSSKYGKEWSGKRPYSMHSVSRKSKINKFFKRQVHKIERVEGKVIKLNE